MSHNDNFAKFSFSPPPPPPPRPNFAPNWEEQGIPVASEWGIPFEQDFDFGIPTPPNFPTPASMTIDNSPAQEPTVYAAPTTPALPTTIEEHLANVFNWPKWDGTPIMPRPITTAAELKTLRIKERRFELKEGEWARDVLTFRQIQNAVLQGDCGVGKSTLATGHSLFFIIIAPTTIIIDQLASHTCQVIKANVEPNFVKYKQFACTYDSLPRFCDAALEAGYNPYLIPLIIDECHHLLSDAFKGGRLDACMSRVRLFKFPTPTSATIPPFIPYLETLPRIVITRKDSEIVNYSYAIGSDVAMIEKCLKQALTVLYHLNNKKMIQVMVSHFTSLGYRVEYIDSDNKDEMMSEGLDEKRLPPAELYICTSVFNDGISVHEHALNYIAIVSGQSARLLGPYEIYQFTKRFRDKAPTHVHIMRKTNEFDDDLIFSEETYKYRYIKTLEMMEKKAKNMTEEYRWMLEALNQDAAFGFLNSSDDFFKKAFPLYNDSFIVFNSDAQIFEPNPRAISEYVYSSLQRACYASRYMMEDWLEKYDLKFCEIIEVEPETKFEKDLLKISKSLKKADREVMRETIASFESYDDALKASQAEIPTTYSQAAELLSFDEFLSGKKEEEDFDSEDKEDFDSEEEEEKLRLEYRKALREKIKEADIKKKAATIAVQHTSAICANGIKFKDAFPIAKRELGNSTLTKKALDKLKYKKLLQAIARGVRNPDLEKVLASAFITEVLQSVTIGVPLDENTVNEHFEHAFRHSSDARERFTVTPKIPRGEPTKEEVNKATSKAAKAQWQKRKELLNYFFEMKKTKKKIDGNWHHVWIPQRALY